MSLPVSNSSADAGLRAPLEGVRVIEYGDEQGEYCGLLLAGLGAEVIRVGPPGGARTRDIGPFCGESPDRNSSLYFWGYNRGKRSVVADLTASDDRARVEDLIGTADVFLDSSPLAELRNLGLSAPELRSRYPHLVVARLSPFGDDGPWAHFKSNDLVHLSLGGVVMNCGYDPTPDGAYDLPPIAPQAWHSYHVAGEQLAMAIVAALLYRERTGSGQIVTCAVHEAVAKSTEIDLMSWIMRRAPIHRQTARHAGERESSPTVVSTKDGRWFTIQIGDARAARRTAQFVLEIAHDAAMRDELEAVSASVDDTSSESARRVPGSGEDPADFQRNTKLMDLIQRLARKYTFEDFPWREAQQAGLLWAPLMKPHENLGVEHWSARGTFSVIEHPEHDLAIPYPTSKWLSSATTWVPGRRAPLVGEDDATVAPRAATAAPAVTSPRVQASRVSRWNKPFALDGVRILDFGWYLASAGGTRFLAAFGAESIKVEFHTHPDTRFAAMAPVGGRAARERATAPLPGIADPDMGGQFNNKNPGKLGLSLNVTHPKGLEIARRLVRISDIVAEGFSPGVLERWGLDYESLRQIDQRIIVAKQSGMGTVGTYGRFRTVGPVAAAFSGLSEMSGLPEPAMPAGWGYSYLDWIGAYSFSLAMLTALYHRERTGEGQYIDASQTETGIFLTAPAVLDWATNGRAETRSGNRSPGRPAAPHGIYPSAGRDRWIAIACRDEDEWRGLIAACDDPALAEDPRFRTLESRLKHQDALDAALARWTRAQDGYALMHRLQVAGVPAGVCQTAEDRYEHDPQLAHMNWLTELDGTKIGRWPVAEVPVHLSESPAFVGGPIDRAAPVYGEDNEYVLGELLGMSTREIADLADEGVI
ncbi:CaiB/BaiF CoA-transferase family protein [Microbacterium ulmi]|uniref:CoA transferase n=1 Tax=Microbacterium ulmi TaxID=179095 RepID=A0A7Y2M096_9MICO|nr:CoA transferase [Microbacterium ulmi]NII69376.1 crotonobetainyl-CoA:carnitine CoA-transferase CaiB-like acyl-CoA transferase [Microbacterium ulmi]NNH04012.1 CoA transferase [Microbacterium ulmi]